MDQTQPRLCFSYLRFSRSEQSKGSSSKRQTDLREAYCARHNLVLDDSRRYEDRGVSGFHGKNLVEGHFAAFLDLVKSGQIPHGSVLLIESIDRFSRDQIIPARNALESLLKSGVEVHTLSPERIYNSDSLKDPFALIGMILEFSRAHEYSVQLGNRIKVAWSSKREKAKSHQTPLSKCPPAWLRVVNGKYQVIPDRGKTVELIYTLCADGLGIRLIARELIRRKTPAFTGKPWGTPYLTKILLSEAPIGHHSPLRRDRETRKRLATEKIPNLYPPVVSETLNAQAKVALRRRRRQGGRVDYENGPIHPFSGLLRTHGGASLHVTYRTVGVKDPKNVAFLRDDSNGNTYLLSAFEFLMLGWIVKYEPEPVRQQNGEITDLEAKIAKLDYRILTLKDKINSGEDFASFLELLATAEKDRKASQDLLQQLRSLTPLNQGLTTISGIFERLGDETDHTTRENNLALRSVLRRMISQVEVTIGKEGRFWPQKSLRVSVTFQDGNRAEFEHRV